MPVFREYNSNLLLKCYNGQIPVCWSYFWRIYRWNNRQVQGKKWRNSMKRTGNYVQLYDHSIVCSWVPPFFLFYMAQKQKLLVYFGWPLCLVRDNFVVFSSSLGAWQQEILVGPVVRVECFGLELWTVKISTLPQASLK